MDDHRSISVSRVYVPNEYTIYLSPADRAQFEGYEDKLRGELEEYLAEHAQRERYALLSPPTVALRDRRRPRHGPVRDRDAHGAAGARRRRRRRRRARERAHARDDADLQSGPPTGSCGGARPRAARDARVPRERRRPPRADGERAVIGRSRECDVQIADPNVSRQHAELRREGGGYVIVDLGSTNGIEVNGRRVKRATLDAGDRISLGQTELVFEREP